MNADKTMLIHAIKGCGCRSMSEWDRWEKIGLARFTGNQWNEKWDWDVAALEANLDESELEQLYLTLRK